MTGNKTIDNYYYNAVINNRTYDQLSCNELFITKPSISICLILCTRFSLHTTAITLYLQLLDYNITVFSLLFTIMKLINLYTCTYPIYIQIDLKYHSFNYLRIIDLLGYLYNDNSVLYYIIIIIKHVGLYYPRDYYGMCSKPWLHTFHSKYV